MHRTVTYRSFGASNRWSYYGYTRIYFVGYHSPNYGRTRRGNDGKIIIYFINETHTCMKYALLHEKGPTKWTSYKFIV